MGAEAHREARARTRERILRGAVQAVALHGIAKLDMGDVSASAGVSRGTLYRYFANRDELLRAVAVEESLRFWEECLGALRTVPPGVERVRFLLETASRKAHDHPALQRLVETDPALVLQGVRAQFSGVRAQLGAHLAPLLDAAPVVKSGLVGPDELLDGLTRLLFSFFLIPSEDPAGPARSLRILDPLLSVDAAHEGSP